MSRPSAVAELRWAMFRAATRVGRLVHPLDKQAKRVAFLHLPKCGGTSLAHAIRRPRGYFESAFDFDVEVFVARATEGAAYDFTSPVLWHNTQVASLRFLHCKAPIVSGHFSLHPSAREFTSEYRFVTVLRDPVERWISHYRYAKAGSGPHLGEFWTATSQDPSLSLRAQLERIIDSPLGLFLGTLQTAMLGGYGLGGRFLEQADRAELLERARGALAEFAVVGVLEDLPSFARQLEASIGPVLELEKRNATADSPRRPKGAGPAELARHVADFERVQQQDRDVKALFDEATRRRIARLCETDSLLYEDAKRRNDQRRS